MKIFDPKRHLPVGWEWEPLKSWLSWAHGLSGLSLIAFLDRYFDARAALYHWEHDAAGRLVRELVPGRMMPRFPELVRGMPLLGVWCFLVLMALQAGRYYRYHRQESMAVYTMRRLPDRWEYHRRCLAQPVLSTIAEVLLFAVLLTLCWLLYYFATPAGHLPPIL